MLVLGIETSCDETAVALLAAKDKPTLLAELVASQEDLHRPYGGVVPEIASREHLRALPLLLDQLLTKSGVTLSEVGLIAVTQGPGLKGCLLIGVNFAKGLSTSLGIPLRGVNHIEGHLLVPMLDNPELNFPFLALVVSGGHTEMHLVRGIGHYEVIGRTTDDAAGEAFDKSAHLLGFPYPGGSRLAALADSVNSSAFTLPRAMPGSLDFSFSGLKTAVSLLNEKTQAANDPKVRAELCHAVQEAIVGTLLDKVGRAVKEYQISDVVVTGGVSANHHLRREISRLKVRTHLPLPSHCTDNAAMIAYVGALRGPHEMEPTAYARWPVETVGDV